MIAVNLTSAFLCARAVLPDLLRPGARCPRIVGLARALAVELAPRQVTVNAVCPGYTQTPLLAAALASMVEKTGRTRSEVEAELLRNTPQGRFLRPEEVAQTVLWLCTPAAQAVTGQAIAVAGGEV